VGKNVSRFKEGDRVTALGTGCFAEYCRIPARCAVAVPDGVRDREALGEPLACLVSAAERTPVSLGDTCAIIGLGYMGIVLMDLIALKGAGKIVAIDARRECEALALRHGADAFFLPDEVPAPMKLTEWGDMDRNYGIDLACEVTGKQAALTLAVEMVRQHGVLNVVGFHQGGPRTVDVQLMNWKALTIVNGHERREDYLMRCMERALLLIARKKLRTDHLITHEYPPDAVDEAFRALETKPEGHVKGVVRM
jgi:threonine dehydrogenase-like Zn-dependent dehydrogenase